jgi:hypothetical protein
MFILFFELLYIFFVYNLSVVCIINLTKIVTVCNRVQKCVISDKEWCTYKMLKLKMFIRKRILQLCTKYVAIWKILKEQQFNTAAAQANDMTIEGWTGSHCYFHMCELFLNVYYASEEEKSQNNWFMLQDTRWGQCPNWYY